ncbi:MAG: hypothetical protein NZZ41_00030 [Candidatus Dojkabacteria bacterium]|nr:hypothetical protein [Candidatus Dojkabacteria bacterium]
MKEIIKIKEDIEKIERNSNNNLIVKDVLKQFKERLNKIFNEYVFYNSYYENERGETEYRSCYEWSKNIKNFRFTLGFSLNDNYYGDIALSIDFIDENGNNHNIFCKKDSFSNTNSNFSFKIEEFIKIYKNKVKILKFLLR